MIVWPILALVFAGLEVLALRQNGSRLEYIAKPGVMVCLLFWLVLEGGLQNNLLWFGVGIIFSLAGDTLLMISLERLFIPGLAAFVLAHLSYLIGLREQLLNVTAWSLILLFFIFLNGIRLLRRIVSAMRARRQDRLIYPVIFYSLVVSLMLYAALSTIFDPAWETSAAFFVSAGAFLFWLSDLILAWNRFVTPIKDSRMINILAYHLGQVGLIAGVIGQFG